MSARGTHMGGTTAKASLITKGVPAIEDGYTIGGEASGQPMQLPVVDIVEIGAGGGSIAWIDPAGALKVGPRSAGAEPGPACYGRGGGDPTLTDANVIAGRRPTRRGRAAVSPARSAWRPATGWRCRRSFSSRSSAYSVRAVPPAG